MNWNPFADSNKIQFQQLIFGVEEPKFAPFSEKKTKMVFENKTATKKSSSRCNWLDFDEKFIYKIWFKNKV